MTTKSIHDIVCCCFIAMTINSILQRLIIFYKQDILSIAEMNSRFRCNETMNRLKYDAKTGYRPHQAHDPWFGIEQEYCVIDDADKPVSYNPHNYDYKTLRKIFIDIFQ